MAKEIGVFKGPADKNVFLWRYMDFAKFVAMLQQNGLYFARADLLGDPFEGTITAATDQARKERLEDLTSLQKAQVADAWPVMTKTMRLVMRINCWHMNRHESAAMWQLYAATNEAIAIKTTYATLQEALDDECYIGRVNYIDFERNPSPDTDDLAPFVNKRISFQHEAEVRAVFPDWDILDDIDFSSLTDEQRSRMDSLNNANLEHTLGIIALVTEALGESDSFLDFERSASTGTPKPVDLNRLIKAIHVAPTAPDWFFDTVKNVVNLYQLDADVIRSELDGEAIY